MSKDIKTVIKEKYTEVITKDDSCCSSSCCSKEVSFVGETYDQLAGYVPEADYGLGCGIPTEFANIQNGDTVLDLGSGAGNDVFVARSLAGPQGHVIGIDMTEAMIALANQNKEKLGYENVEFVLGEIEDMPLQSGAIDVVISNCVLNLVPEKGKAYKEIHRVLKPGGHFSISDIVIVGELHPKLRDAAALYAGCISGALQKEEYLNVVKSAGFKEVKVAKERLVELPYELLEEYLEKEELEMFKRRGASLYSITVTGTK